MFITLADTQIILHCRGNIQRRLGKQPEGDNTKNNAEQQLVVAFKAGCGIVGSSCTHDLNSVLLNVNI
ncbi:hypothetical protein J2T37_001215 [Neisseria perflava]|nr:hypothetical protein [Neisseria perflava]